MTVFGTPEWKTSVVSSNNNLGSRGRLRWEDSLLWGRQDKMIEIILDASLRSYGSIVCYLIKMMRKNANKQLDACSLKSPKKIKNGQMQLNISPKIVGKK